MLTRHVGVAFDVGAVEADLNILSGLDRYETITWRIAGNAAGETGLLVEAQAKPHSPPFLMLGLNLENTTSQDFRVTFTARYLGYDLVGSGSELRVDGMVGSDPSLGAELYRPLGSSALFVAPYAGMAHRTFDFIADNAIVARYATDGEPRGRGSRRQPRTAERPARRFLHRARRCRCRGRRPGAARTSRARRPRPVSTWRYNSQDSAVVPGRGIAAYTNLAHVFDSPPIAPPPATSPVERGPDATER